MKIRYLKTISLLLIVAMGVIPSQKLQWNSVAQTEISHHLAAESIFSKGETPDQSFLPPKGITRRTVVIASAIAGLFAGGFVWHLSNYFQSPDLIKTPTKIKFQSPDLIKTPTKINIQNARSWMMSRIHQNGLIASFKNIPEGDPSYGVTWTYNQAQAIQAFIALGDIQIAEKLAQGLLSLPRNPEENHQAWLKGYFTDTMERADKIDEQKQTKVGHMMAIGHALLNLIEKTKDPILAGRLMDEVFNSANWLFEYYIEEGEYGYVQGGKYLTEVWTEHNQRAFGFLYQLYNQIKNNKSPHNQLFRNKLEEKGIDAEILKFRADKIIKWIQEQMWDEGGGLYLAGYKDPVSKELIPNIIADYPTDDPQYWNRHAWAYHQYLGVIMADVAGLDPNDFSGGLSWTLQHLSEFEINHKRHKAVPRWLGTSSLWGKGTSELATALLLIGRKEEAKELLETLSAMQDSTGGVLAAVGDQDRIWPIHFPYPSIEATSPSIISSLVLEDKRNSRYIAMTTPDKVHTIGTRRGFLFAPFAPFVSPAPFNTSM